MWFSRCWACERKDEYHILWMKKWERKLFSTITHGHTLARTHSGPHIYKQEICLFEVCSYAAKNTWRRTWLADLQGQQGGYIPIVYPFTIRRRSFFRLISLPNREDGNVIMCVWMIQLLHLLIIHCGTVSDFLSSGSASVVQTGDWCCFMTFFFVPGLSCMSALKMSLSKSSPSDWVTAQWSRENQLLLTVVLMIRF